MQHVIQQVVHVFTQWQHFNCFFFPEFFYWAVTRNVTFYHTLNKNRVIWFYAHQWLTGHQILLWFGLAVERWSSSRTCESSITLQYNIENHICFLKIRWSNFPSSILNNFRELFTAISNKCVIIKDAPLFLSNVCTI